MAAACTSFPPAAASNASSRASATSRTGRRTARSFSSSVRSCFPICRRSTWWAWMESRRVLSGPTCSVNSVRFTRPGILTASASPSGGRPARESSQFLTVPLEDGSRATRTDVGARPAGPRARLAGQVRLGAFAAIHLFRGTRRRYAERLARYRRSADRRVGRWPRTPDDRCGRGDERRHLAGRDEADLHGDVEQNEAVVVPLRPGQRARHG